MDSDYITIVCYTGGTCGDLISAMIDPCDIGLNTAAGTVVLPAHRIKLKKPHMFRSALIKDQYLQTVNTGTCISSHDLDYHVDRQHQFIGITVQDFNIALWAARRFKKLHRPQVWTEMQQRCGAGTVEQYAQILIDYSNMVVDKTDKIVTLESIVSTHAATTIQNITGIAVSSAGIDFYQTWLDLQQL